MDEFTLLIGQLQAGDGQVDEALLLDVKGDPGAGGDHVVEGELGEDGEGGALCQGDREGDHLHCVDGAGLGSVRAEAILDLVNLEAPGRDEGEASGEDEELHAESESVGQWSAN